MKVLTPPSLLAAALLSAVAVIPFLPTARSDKPVTFFVELKLASNTPGRVQIFYDDGLGFRENLSSIKPLPPGGTTGAVLLPLPAGYYRQFRLDPIDGAGRVVLVSAKIVDETGRPVRDLALTDFTELHQIQSLDRTEGGLVIVTLPGANDPQLLLTLKPPLTVRAPLGPFFWSWLTNTLPVFAALVALLALMHFTNGWQAPATALFAWLRACPSRAVVVTATAAVIASSYPVVFLGKSFVSPNWGTALLYDRTPTLPGYRSNRVAEVKGSDIGAIMWQHVPYSMLQRDAVLGGELPLWNRYNSSGVPEFGQGQSMFGDPLNLLVSAANGASWAWDLKYLVAKWLLAVAVGLSVLLLSGRPSAALLIAASSPFIGFFVYRVNHPAIFSLCYSPWVVFCWLKATRAENFCRTLGWGAALGLANWMLMVSGTVKEAYMLLLSLNFAGLLLLLFHHMSARDRLAKLGLLSWIGLLFVLLSAPLWMNFLDALGKSYTSYDTRSAYQIQPGLILGVFDEVYYRPLTTLNRVFNPSANFLILLGILYFLATLRSHWNNRAALALTVASLVPLSLAFGLVSPRWIGNTPFLGNIAHIDNSFSCVLIVLWTLLAGVGLATAASRLRSTEARGDFIICALLLFAVILAYVGYGQAAHRSVFGAGSTFSPIEPGNMLPVSTFVWNSLLASIAAAVVAAIVVWRAVQRRALKPAGVLLLIACALVWHWRQAMHSTAVGFDDYVVKPPVRVDFDAPSEAVKIMQDNQNPAPSRGIGLGDNFFPGWTDAYRLESTCGPDALANPYYRELCSVAPIGRIWDWRLYLTADKVAAARPFLDFLNVRFYFASDPSPALSAAGLRLVRQADLTVYESPTVWPRAFFTDRLARYDGARDLMWLIKTETTPFAAIRHKDSPKDSVLESVSSEYASRQVVPATDYHLTTNSTAFDVDAPRSGVVVLTETWSPRDFIATLNGNQVPVLRLNHAFKGVYVPAAGHYHVAFRYWPEHLTLSLWLFATGGVLAILTVVAVRRRSVPVA
jgi:hypothetical protein